ncbi:Hypothetical protein, putative, partial [Bodo saltans]
FLGGASKVARGRYLFGVGVSRPLHAAVTLLLSALSAGLQAALLMMQSASSPVDVATLERLMLGSAVCDLCVMGISSLRLLLDLRELMTALLRKVKERCSRKIETTMLMVPLQTRQDSTSGGVLRSPSSSVSLVLPTACDTSLDNLYGDLQKEEH